MDESTIDNAVRGRFNAYFFAALESYMHWKYAGIKGDLLKDAPPVIVELGPGAGANFRYFPKGTCLIGVEPNRHFHPILKRRAKQFGIELDLRVLKGESLDLGDETVDFVFSSLVLCSVNEPARVLAEVMRVLKPGGRFACVEHVAAPDGSTLRKVQKSISRPWKWVFEGCDLCRDTGATLKLAGFSQVALQPMVLPTIFIPIRTQISAVCTK